MLSITAASLAGGQGKTTSSFFLAKALARIGYKVLMVDTDPQSSLTLYLAHEVGIGTGYVQILQLWKDAPVSV